MFKRLVFALGLAMFIALPGFCAEITAESKCDAATLSTSENADFVDIEAFWIPNQYSCNAGDYLRAANVTCESCLPGYYCLGFAPFDFDGANHGLSVCPAEYSESESGADSIDDCYRMDTAYASERNPYTYGHGTPVYRNESAPCKQYHGNGSCDLLDPSALDMVDLICDTGYTKDTVDDELRCVRSGAICVAGTYLAAGAQDCSACIADHYCGGGFYAFDDIDQGITACESGLKSPVGTKSVKDCGHLLHVDDDVVYLHADKRTEPSLVVDVDGVPYYANMTKVEDGIEYMSPETTKVLRMTVEGIEYTVHTNIAEPDD